jgi:menaquinone-dependent protoporphyrinogen oxidase
MEIADRIGGTLQARGIDTDVLPAEQVASVAKYDAVLLGSAVYAGHWLPAGRDLVERETSTLSSRPTWLFSSGPIGDPPKPEEEPVDVDALMKAIGPREHRVFAGKLDRGNLGFAERAITRALRAPEGDFRDWDAISAWAQQIARELTSQS